MKTRKLSLLVAAVMTLGLVGCNNNDKTIHLQLVPSNDPTTLLTRAKALAPMLKKYEPDYDWVIDVGTSYAATTQALQAGQIDGGFLTSSGYAQLSIEHPKDVDLLLSATRKGYKIQADDFPGTDAEARETQRKHMNGADGYSYHGEQSETEVNFYCSVVFTLKDSERIALGKTALDTNGDGKVSLAELHDAKALWGTMGATSSSGFNYPTKYIFENGYTGGFEDKDTYEKQSEADQKIHMINRTETSYQAMVDDVMTGQIDVAVGFFDIRYGSAFVQTGSKYNGDNSVFDKTYTQAVLDPIMNDTVCAYSRISDAKKNAIKNALKKAVKDGDIKDDGNKNDINGDGQPSAAYLVYQIYSHIGYVDGKDSDYDVAREMYRWQLSNGSTKK